MNVNLLPRNMQSKINVTPAGCWHWTGALNSKGYGAVGVLGVSKSTHRVAYELLVGPIPDDLQIDHLCRNKPCCNPEHLEPVTALENMRRRPDVNKPVCVNGHEMTEENTIIKKRPLGYAIRNCRQCAADSQRRAREKAKAEGKSTARPPLVDGDPRHGTLSGYTNHRCRCEKCRAAMRAYEPPARTRQPSARSGIGTSRSLAG